MSLFRKSAGYRYLDAFILANVVELATRHFCVAFLNVRNDPGGRSFAQMTHAARSGSRNIAEGSERLMTSYASASRPCAPKHVPGTRPPRRTRPPARNAARPCVCARRAKRIAPSGAAPSTPPAAA